MEPARLTDGAVSDIMILSGESLAMTAIWFRTDLIEADDSCDPRRAKLIDAVSGRVAKISRRDLATLRRFGDDTSPQADHATAGGDTAALVNDAIRMGLMTRRANLGQRPWQQLWASGPARLICIRLPLFSIDRLAQRLSQRSDMLFHPLAIAFWSFAILLAAASVLVGWDRAVLSAGRMQLWGEYSMAGWAAIAAIFVLTKIAHELAHAAACRRGGAACGEIGLMFFVGMPCPYCDVSLVSRLDSAMARAGVMLAGIYVELVIATIATAVWWIASPGPVEAMALNVMIVCGISTLVFNANPLMRLDGYYVLSDMIGTSNLRARATAAWQQLVSSRLGNWSRGRAPITMAETSLATYHAASAVYRITVMLAIGWMVLAIADSVQMRPLGMAFVAMLVLPMLFAVTSGISGVISGKGPWGQSHWSRRGAVVLATSVIAAIVLLTPLRREVVVTGILDVADATPIHATQSGWIVDRQVDFESPVISGQSLWQLDDPRLRLELAAWDNRKRLASLQSAALRRSALSDNSPDMAWDLDAANRRLVESQLQSLVDRSERLVLTSPASGILLPPTPNTQRQTGVGDRLAETRADMVGRYADAGEYLARVGDPNRLAVTLYVDARHRRLIREGQAVRLIGDFGDATTVPWTAETVVGQISEIRQGDQTATVPSMSVWNPSQKQFDLRCDLPDDASATWIESYNSGSLATLPIGAEVIARIRVGDESLWDRAVRSIRESLGE